jgi:hypothetical protein
LGGKFGKLFEVAIQVIGVVTVVIEGRSTVGVGPIGMVTVEKVSTVLGGIVVAEEAAEFVAVGVIGVNATDIATGKATVLGVKLMAASVVDAIPGGVAIVTLAGIAVAVVTVVLEVANVISDE